MFIQHPVKHATAWLFFTIAAVLSFPGAARATPAFSRQTGMSCAQCHVSFPELTPFGRNFKAGGYTLSTEKVVTDKVGDRSTLELLGLPPLAIMIETSYTHTADAQTLAPGRPAARNDDFLFPQQLSLFYTGKIAPHVGAFIQLTYDGVANSIALDNTDIRYSSTASLLHKDLIFGVTLNNNPTVSDLWNSTPAWGFPFASSNVAPKPGAATRIDGGFAQSVAGLGMYGYWNNLLYAEFDLYHSAPLGVSRPLDAANGASNVIAGVAPYWRLVVQHDWGAQSWAVGTFGMTSRLFPGGSAAAPLEGATDRFTDVALDSQYQYIGEHHIVCATASWIHENQFLDATGAAGGAAQVAHELNTVRFTASYWYERLIGARLGFFAVNGTSDPILFAPASITGSSTGSPYSNGFVGELDIQPYLNTKFVLQYVGYVNFNGSRSNYDGAGRSASSNNTVYALTWLAF
jgi:hypothetical protein